MFGRTSQLTGLAMRKQLLVLSSEVNRMQLVRACTVLRGEMRVLGSSLRASGSVVSKASLAIATVAAVRQIFRPRQTSQPRPTWLSIALRAAQIGSSLWSGLRRSPP